MEFCNLIKLILCLGLLSNDKEESSARSGNLKDNHLVIDVHAVEKDDKLLKVGDKPCDPNDPIQAELANCILKLKSVFKCRLCPRIILLNENTVRTHLSSKVSNCFIYLFMYLFILATYKNLMLCT